MIKSTPLVTGPLEVARLGTNIQSISPEDRATHFGQYDHVRIYGRDYFDRLRNVGFKVEEVDYSLKLSPDLVEKYCLAKGEILPVCFKP